MCSDRSECCTKAMRSYGFKSYRHWDIADYKPADLTQEVNAVDNNGPRGCFFKGIKCHRCLIFLYFGLENVSLTFF